MDNLKQNERITELRNRLGLTMEAFGEKIGLSRQSISNIESGRRSVTNRMIMAVASKYGVSEKWLETGEGEIFMADTQAYRQLREKVDRMLSDESDAFRAALVDVVMHLNSEQIDILKEYAAKYYGVDVGSGLASQESAGSGPDPGAAPREADISQGPAFDQASAETAADPAETLQKRSGLPEEPAQPAADPAETLQKRSGLPEEPAQPAADPAETLPEGSGISEADEAEIRRKAQEYADMLREEKRAEGRSSSLNDGRLKKEA